MKRILLLLALCSACGGKLSEEERKKLHDGMSSMDIRRVSDADLQMAAIAYGQSVMKAVEQTDPSFTAGRSIDSLEKVFGVRIHRLEPTDSALREIERLLVEAYIEGGNTKQAGENLQKIGEDSLLFTRPVFAEQPDGSQQFRFALGIRMATKTVVLSMPKP